MNHSHPSFRSTALRLRHNARRMAGLGLGGVLVAVTALASTGAPAGAAPGQHVSDVITFTSHVYLTPPQNGVGHFAIVGDTCQLQPTGQASIPCSFVGGGTVGATGGVARGVVTSRNGTIVLDETYVFTGPTTSTGTGPTTKVSGGVTTLGTFVGNFTTAPTSNPNVLLDWGTFVVSENN